MDEPELHVPPGHYYSPIPARRDIARASACRDAPPRTLPGIDLRDDAQCALLAELAPLYRGLPFEEQPGVHRFGYDNTWFTDADAVFLALILRWSQPRRVIEVGCGYSSAVILDAQDLWLEGTAELTFIDPDPERLHRLARAGDLDGRLITSAAQDIPQDVFATLSEGDILAVDSSHVLKAGSDVHYLVTEILPRLKPGVLVHVHDVFYPFEYPDTWLNAGVAFTEAYALRLLLQESTAWRIELFTDYVLAFHSEIVERDFPRAARRRFPTGGLWLRRT